MSYAHVHRRAATCLGDNLATHTADPHFPTPTHQISYVCIMVLGLVLYWSSLFTLLPNPWVPAYHADIGICGFFVCMVAFVAACRSDCLCVRCMIGRPTCPPPTCPLSGSAALPACRSCPCIITASVEGFRVIP